MKDLNRVNLDILLKSRETKLILLRTRLAVLRQSFTIAVTLYHHQQSPIFFDTVHAMLSTRAYNYHLPSCETLLEKSI
jgi:hypothetical protein